MALHWFARSSPQIVLKRNQPLLEDSMPLELVTEIAVKPSIQVTRLLVFTLSR
jgi:hypothetical protein